jgi:putative DNA primase/helicase
VVRLVGGDLPEVVDRAEQALIAAGGFDLYRRGTQVVFPIRPRVRAADSRWTYSWQLEVMSKARMREIFTRVVDFRKWNQRAKDYLSKDCPEDVAEVYLARIAKWKLPILFGIVNTPFLQRDGSPCERPGYDRSSGLLFIPERGSFPSIPTQPTREDAQGALKWLNDTLLAEFPFVEKVDRSVALSGLLTAHDRHAMSTAPLHGFSSPTAGTGKSLLVDLGSVLMSGQPAPVIAQARTEEETDKRLATALLAGDRIISLDNLDNELCSALLCQALTQEQLKIRVLGYSRHVQVPVAATFFATGNNLVVASDLTRRTLLCQLDAGMERPELRKFKTNVLEVAREKRGELVVAVLTILRAWHLAKTKIGVDPLGGFEDWSFRVRSPLLWLDQADPCDSIKTVRENDPTRSQLDAVLQQWKQTLGTKSVFTVQRIIERAVVDPDLFAALAAVAASSQGMISNDRLGRWLNKNNGKIVGRLKLIRAGSTGGYPTWQVIDV